MVIDRNRALGQQWDQCCSTFLSSIGSGEPHSDPLGIHISVDISQKWILTLSYLIEKPAAHSYFKNQRFINYQPKFFTIYFAKSLGYSTPCPLLVHLKVIIVNLKKLIYKHRYLYSIVFFFKSVLYGWCFNLETQNLASEKIKPAWSSNQARIPKKFSFYPLT